MNLLGVDLLLFPDKADKQLSANRWQEELEVFQSVFRRLEPLLLCTRTSAQSNTETGKPQFAGEMSKQGLTCLSHFNQLGNALRALMALPERNLSSITSLFLQNQRWAGF